MVQTIKTALADIRQTIARLERLLAEVDSLPPLHTARLDLKLGSIRGELETLLSVTESLTVATR